MIIPPSLPGSPRRSVMRYSRVSSNHGQRWVGARTRMLVVKEQEESRKVEKNTEEEAQVRRDDVKSEADEEVAEYDEDDEEDE